ncbi:MAG: hypothetical protein WKF37_09420 [Bryobacteraceae bacterium]
MVNPPFDFGSGGLLFRKPNMDRTASVEGGERFELAFLNVTTALKAVIVFGSCGQGGMFPKSHSTSQPVSNCVVMEVAIGPEKLRRINIGY